MKSFDIIAYSADADIYCPDCAETLYPSCEIDDPDNRAEDGEGNEVHPIFAGDMEFESGIACCECGVEIC